MSVPFTNPAGATWQTLLNEITSAYSERRRAVGQSYYAPATNTIVQSASYWTALQIWLEDNCTSFIDWVDGPLTEAGNNFLYFTFKKWRAAAGLNAYGFRRSTDGSSFSYGQMQAGDIIGPWIFEDLQRGIGALRMKKTKVIATKITHAGVDPEWDLTPYQGNGIGIIDGIVGYQWAITGRGMAYGVQNSGEINDDGQLVDLPGTYTADLWYDGSVSLEVWYFDAGTYR
jgi:hypothetical protein